MGLCASLVDDTPLHPTPAIVDLSPSQRCVLEHEYWKNWFLMGYPHNSFGESVQCAGLPLNKSATTSSRFLFAATTPGYPKKECSVSVTATTTILQENQRKSPPPQRHRKGLPRVRLPPPPPQRPPAADVPSGTTAADAITTTTTAAITGTSPRVLKGLLTGLFLEPRRSRSLLTLLNPPSHASEDPDSFGTAKAQIFV